MIISGKTKAINNKIKQNLIQIWSQYDLVRQTDKISILLSGNVNKCKLLAGKYVLQEKDWVGKAAAIKRFENYPLVKEFKKQTSVAEKQY